MSVAQTILDQLGGNRFIVMTGARNFVAHPYALSFKLPAGLAVDGINYVKIDLSPSDLYRVEVYRLKGTTLEPRGKRSASGVYADQLRSVFTDLTGLETSLGTMGAKEATA
jgi:hypothetical protein